MKNLILILILFTIGCSTLNQDVDSKYFYKRDLRMKANDDKNMRESGILVLPRLPIYHLKIRSLSRLDLVTISSCHREDDIEPGGSDTIYYDYAPIDGLETSYCPLRISGYDKKHGKHSWGFIDFQDSYLNYSTASLICNGSVSVLNGVGVCQSKEGLIQRIIFNQEMTVDPDPECEFNRNIKSTVFDIELKRAECVYLFHSLTSPMKYFRLTTLGYERILLLPD